MEFVNQKRKLELEQRLGFAIYPLTVEDKGVFDMALFVGEFTLNVYKCAKDYAMAHGGKESQLQQGVVITPCSMEFAENCPIFKQYGRLVAIVYPNLHK